MDFYTTLVRHLHAIALEHGATLTYRNTLLPLSIASAAKQGDFSRGVLSTVAELHALMSESAQGRQALRDLGFEPAHEHIERE